MLNFGNVVATAASIGVTTWMMRRMTADARRTPAPDADGTVALRYGPMVVGAGVLCLAVAVLIAGIGIAAPPRPGERVAWLSLVGAFGVGGLWLTLVALRYGLAVGRTGVRQEAFGRKPVVLLWSAVRAVSFSRVSGYLTLEGATGRVRASVMLRGVDCLWEAIEAHVPRTQCDAYVHQLAGRAT